MSLFFLVLIFISSVAAGPSECRTKYESWFDNNKGVGSFGFTLQNNSETLLLYSFGNILYSPAPFDYYTNVNSFVTYSDAGSPAAGMPVFAPAEPPFLFFDARSLIIQRNGLISISSVGQMGSSVQFEVTCDGDVFTGVGQDGNLYVLQFHPTSTSTSAPTAAPTTAAPTSVPTPASTPSATPTSQCKATVVAKPRNGAVWQEGTDSFEVIDFAISNIGSSKITSLTVDLTFSSGASATSSWNMAASSPSTYTISLNDFSPRTTLNTYAGLIVKNGGVSVANIYPVCA